jgi:hypothetical protein
LAEEEIEKEEIENFAKIVETCSSILLYDWVEVKW